MWKQGMNWYFLLIKIIKLIRASLSSPRDRLKRLTVEHMMLPLLHGKGVVCCCLLYLGLKKNELGFWQHHLLSIMCLATCQDIVWSDLHLLTETGRWIPALIHLASALVLPTLWRQIPPFHSCFFLKPRIFSDSEILITAMGSQPQQWRCSSAVFRMVFYCCNNTNIKNTSKSPCSASLQDSSPTNPLQRPTG